MAELAREHGDLAAVVRVVRDQVAKKSRGIGAEVPNAAIGRHSAAEDYAQSVSTALQGSNGLRRGHGGAIKLVRNLVGLTGFQPHHPHVVHMSNDGGDCPSLAVWRLRFPCRERKVIDQILVDSVVGVEGVQKRYRNLADVWILKDDSINRVEGLRHGLACGRLGKGINLA